MVKIQVLSFPLFVPGESTSKQGASPFPFVYFSLTLYPLSSDPPRRPFPPLTMEGMARLLPTPSTDPPCFETTLLPGTPPRPPFHPQLFFPTQDLVSVHSLFCFLSKTNGDGLLLCLERYSRECFRFGRRSPPRKTHFLTLGRLSSTPSVCQRYPSLRKIYTLF